MQEIGVPGPKFPLDGTPATKELEPPSVHEVRRLIASARPLRLVDELLRAVEPLPIKL
jgi:hypothetical protein